MKNFLFCKDKTIAKKKILGWLPDDVTEEFDGGEGRGGREEEGDEQVEADFTQEDDVVEGLKLKKYYKKRKKNETRQQMWFSCLGSMLFYILSIWNGQNSRKK